MSVYKKIQIIDFVKVMAELKERGWSLRAINRETGLHMSTLSRLANEENHIPYEPVTSSVMSIYESGDCPSEIAAQQQ